ncbi:right-handed parallel beta-helix repeat-containing protein [Motilibacter deserti]|uniref:Right-handed parallel beta-helix repeat-containing protein n=1 Tax=Motilibacter deserti TaxID=2714956 RepID=A0ABX0GTD3_9ACTN|nr:right-handed parallel beta-helix repeat-containing protein [Motilibacter deserti]
MRLTTDLECSGTGLFVGAPGITIDLAGHTVSGPGRGVGIDNYGEHDGVVVRRGTVRGFTHGVYFERAAGGRIDRVTTTDNAIGIAIGHGEGVVLERVDASGNEFAGIEVMSSEDTTVRRSTVNDNGHGGVIDRYSTGNTYERNELNRNVFYGLLLYQAEDAVAERNLAADNRYDGFALDFWTEGALLDRNEAVGNGEHGFRIDEPGNRLVRNRATGNSALGFSAPEGTVDLGGNRAAGNAAGGCTYLDC